MSNGVSTLSSSKHNNFTEKELIKRALNKDSIAQQEIIRKYKNKIFSIAYYYLKDEHEAYDLVQEVFIKVFKALNTFRGEAGLGTWIYRIAVNSAKNKISFFNVRRWFKRKSIEDTLPGTELKFKDILVSHEISAEQKVLYKERATYVNKAIKSLDIKYREVIILIDMEGLSYEETANILNIKIGTVRSRLHRARAILMDLLKDYIDGDI